MNIIMNRDKQLVETVSNKVNDTEALISSDMKINGNVQENGRFF